MTTRPITRYGSRKLYDTLERKYASLEKLARRVRDGEHLRVTDHRSGQDVTAQTLALVLYEQARQGALVATEVLHDVIRTGTGANQRGAAELVSGDVDRMKPLARAREELVRVREGMKEIERSLAELGGRRTTGRGARRPAPGRKTERKRKKT